MLFNVADLLSLLYISKTVDIADASGANMSTVIFLGNWARILLHSVVGVIMYSG